MLINLYRDATAVVELAGLSAISSDHGRELRSYLVYCREQITQSR